MSTPLKVLIIDDSENDARLLVRRLEMSGYTPQWSRVETRDGLDAALDEGGWQVVLADLTLPRFSGQEALQMVQQRGLDPPFIFVSGTVGEEAAVDAMRAGAHDYVMKNNLARLGPAVEREVREAAERVRAREGRRRAEHALQAHAARLLQQEVALLALARSNGGDTPSLQASLERITSVSARTLGVSRVSAWQYDSSRTVMRCMDLYELAADRHSSGMELAAQEYPRYFRSLAEHEVIAADQAHVEPCFQELVEPYLAPLGIMSMMDAPVIVGGALAGVICHEHIGPPREWTHDERTFAVASATVVALVIEARERKEAEKALRQSQQAYASLVDSVGGIVWEADAQTLRFQFVSQQAERLLGYPVERWLTEPDFWSRHVHPDDRGWTATSWRESAGGLQDQNFKYRMIASDGSIVWLHDLVTVVVEPGRRPLLRGIMVDVTEAMRAEEALRASEQRFRQVTENIDEVFWLTDVGKREIIYVSPAYQRVWGRPCESVAADPTSWLEAVHAEDGPRVRDAIAALADTRTYDVEYRIVRPDGAVRWVHDRAFPIADARGEVYRVAGVTEDVTARRQLESQLRQAQKMEAIGLLAGGVAHDFNNLLAVIQMQSSLLLTVPVQSGEMREGLQEIMAAADRAANLTRQLLTFSRREVAQTQDIDLANVTDGITKLLRRILGEQVALDTRVAHGLPLVHADPGMMEQVLMNLAINARDAMPTGGELLISLDSVTFSPEDSALRPRAMPGRFVRLRVDDTGCGIPPADLPRIFEPFFTTKEPGKGTGLGLATTFGIVEQHHGWIDVASRVGIGTTFSVYLPALPPTAVLSPETISEARLPGGHESILLVEDEAAVRDLARICLEHCGYHVHQAASAAEALSVWERLEQPVDLLLTDLIMPGGTSGYELAAHLLERQPGLKVIYSSGYSNDVVNRELRRSPGRTFLQKPYRVADLAHIVRRCLDEG